MPLIPGLSFSRAFYTEGPVHTEAASPIAAAAAAHDASVPRISYSAAQYRSAHDFQQHPDFAQFEAQFRQGFAQIDAFCERHEMPDRAQLHSNFETFLDRRFSGEGLNVRFFGGVHLELVDGPGKRAFDEMLAMLHDESIDLLDRKGAVRALADGLTVCAPGVATHLIDSSRELALCAGGLRSAVWQTKEAIFQAEVLKAVRAEFDHEPSFAGSELHYCNAVRNSLAAELGLAPIDDHLIPALERDFVEHCGALIDLALRPTQVAMHLAEACHAEVGKTLTDFCRKRSPDDNSLQAVYRYDTDAQTVIDSALVAARKRYGEVLRQHSLVRIDADDASFTREPAAPLLVTDILEAMDKERLLTGGATTAASWITPDGERATAYMADDMLWLVLGYGERHRRGLPDPTGLRGDLNSERVLFDRRLARQLADQLPAASLRAHQRRPSYAEVSGDGRSRTLPAPLARSPSQARPATGSRLVERAELQALQGLTPAQLMQLPAASVSRAGFIRPFFARLTPAQAVDYLRANTAHFTGLRLQWQARAELADCALPALVAARPLRQALYPDPWGLTGEPLTQSGSSRLAVAMRDNQVAQLEALARCHEQATAAPSPFFVSRLKAEAILATLSAKDAAGTPGLSHAMRCNSPAAVESWGRILMCMDTLPRPVQEFIQGRLAELLAAKTATGEPVMFVAAQGDRAAAMEEWCELLKTQPVSRNVRTHLVELIAAKDATYGMTALSAAAVYDQAAVVRAWSELVKSPNIFPHIAPHLAELLGTKDAYTKSPALAVAAACCHAAVIDAWRELVVESPQVLQRLAADLPELLVAKNHFDDPALTVAVAYGTPATIKAMGALILAPRAKPHIEGCLMELLKATSSVGSGSKSAIELVLTQEWPDLDSLRAYLEVIETAVPRLTGAQIKELLEPCRAVFAAIPAQAAPSDQRLQIFREMGERIAAASGGSFAISDVLAERPEASPR